MVVSESAGSLSSVFLHQALLHRLIHSNNLSRIGDSLWAQISQIPVSGQLPDSRQTRSRLDYPSPFDQTPEWFRSWKDPRPWYLLARVAGASDVDRVVAMLARARDAQRMGGTMRTAVDALIERLDNGISGGGLLGG